jgi:hypothetical protein
MEESDGSGTIMEGGDTAGAIVGVDGAGSILGSVSAVCMELKHGLSAWTGSMDWGHGLGAWTGSMDWGHGLGAWTLSMDLQHGLESWTLSMGVMAFSGSYGHSGSLACSSQVSASLACSS